MRRYRDTTLDTTFGRDYIDTDDIYIGSNSSASLNISSLENRNHKNTRDAADKAFGVRTSAIFVNTCLHLLATIPKIGQIGM